jgi:kinesin family member 15
MQRSFEYIFESVENEKSQAQLNGSEMKYLIKCSYLEIYNEQVMDLLEPGSTNMHVREDIKTGVYVDGLQEETVSSVRDMITLITRGARNRHVGSTNMNKESSRSHSVLTTIIESKTMQASGVWQMKSSQFHIIDLAGSERSKHTNAEGVRLKEAGMINQSLSTLGLVINSLVDIADGKQRHVHYRNSKLTFLLRDSLGGNSKTVIIANITPSAVSVNETMSTLKFA